MSLLTSPQTPGGANSANRIALYTEEFLSPSMTFIHRQLNLLAAECKCIVLTRRRVHEELFPFSPVYHYPQAAVEIASRAIRKRFARETFSLGERARAHFREILAREQPSLIHAHFGPSALQILPVAIEMQIPLVTTFHGFDASSYLRNSRYTSALPALFASSFLITVSEEMRQRLIRLGAREERTRCIYLGVPTDKFVPTQRIALREKVRARKKIQFFQAANFVAKKGQLYTLRAFRCLLATLPNSELVFAGAGPLLADSQKLAEELGILSHVKFLGHQSSESVAKLMTEADCFVHHSITAPNGDTEGIPTVLMEAMASGLPVISTVHAGIPELVRNGHNGYLCAERDVSTYATLLHQILDDDGTFGRRARETVESNFDMRRQVKELMTIYRQLTDAPNRRR